MTITMAERVAADMLEENKLLRGQRMELAESLDAMAALLRMHLGPKVEAWGPYTRAQELVAKARGK